MRSVEPLGIDQGLFATFGRFVPEGRLPYRDIFDTKPPLLLYTWVLAWRLGGSVAGVWWFEVAWLAATMALAGALATRLWGRATGLAAAGLLIFALWTPGFGGYWARAQAEVFLALPILGAAWLALAADARPRLAFWAGVLTGVAGLYKIPAMGIGGAWVLGWVVRGPARPAAGRVLLFGAGLLAPWLCALGWFAAHGALGDLYAGVIVTQRHYAASITPPWGQMLAQFGRTLAVETGALLAAAAAGIVLAWRADRRVALWLTAWLGLALAAVALQRQLAGYHYLLVAPAAALAAARGLTGLAAALARARLPMRAVAAVALLGIVLLGAREAAAWQYGYGLAASCRLGRMSRPAYLRRMQRGSFSPALEEDIGRWLRARTPPGAGILVWGLAPGVYVHADRHPVTRYPFHKILLTEAPLSRMIPGLAARRADFMRRLAADPPAYILVGVADPNGFEPDDSVASLQRFEELRAFVAGGYERETALGGRFLVYRRAPRAPPSQP